MYFIFLSWYSILYLADDTKQLNRFPSGGYSDESTIVYLQHPCVVLTALEVCKQHYRSKPVRCNYCFVVLGYTQVIGYTVIASSSTAVKQDYNEYMWTLRRGFSSTETQPSTSTAASTTSTTSTATTTASAGPVATTENSTQSPITAD